MKKLILFLFFLASNYILSQPSGWEDKSIYFEQKLKIDQLNLLHFDDYGSRFYTLHANKKVYYWDTFSGNLVDSLTILDSTGTGVFSKDGKSLCYYPTITILLGPGFDFEVSIYDLSAKRRIAKAKINIPKDIYYQRPNPTLGWIWDVRNITILDYDYKSKTLTCAISFKYWYSVNYGVQTYEYDIICGGCSLFKVESDTFKFIRQIPGYTTYDLITQDSVDYFTVFTRSYYHGGSGSIQLKRDENEFSLACYNNLSKDYETLKNQKYEYHYSWTASGEKSESFTGINRLYTSLMFDSYAKRLYMKSEDIYYVFDTSNNDLIDSIKLLNSKGYEKISYNFSNFIYYFNKQILIQSIKDKILTDSLSCPLNINSLELKPFGKDIIVSDKSGSLLLYKNDTNLAKNNDEVDSQILISPNPTSDFIEVTVPNIILDSSQNPQVRIYNVYGEELTSYSHYWLRTSQYSFRIGIKSIPPGLYFVRVGDKVGKFLKY